VLVQLLEEFPIDLSVVLIELFEYFSGYLREGYFMIFRAFSYLCIRLCHDILDSFGHFGLLGSQE